MSEPPDAAKNCLSYWFPKLEAAGLPVPRTLWRRWDGAWYDVLEPDTPDQLVRAEALVAAVTQIVREIGAPCFLRTGRGSGKHDWPNTCYLPDLDQVQRHVYALCEWSGMADLLGLPVDVWVAREYLPVEPIFHAFAGMPVVPEMRYFVSEGVVCAARPYWPEDAIFRPSREDWRDRLRSMTAGLIADRDEHEALALRVAEAFAGDGAWSVDVLLTRNGWHVTDMAQAAHSWGCPPELGGRAGPEPAGAGGSPLSTERSGGGGG